MTQRIRTERISPKWAMFAVAAAMAIYSAPTVAASTHTSSRRTKASYPEKLLVQTTGLSARGSLVGVLADPRFDAAAALWSGASVGDHRRFAGAVVRRLTAGSGPFERLALGVDLTSREAVVKIWRADVQGLPVGAPTSFTIGASFGQEVMCGIIGGVVGVPFGVIPGVFVGSVAGAAVCRMGPNYQAFHWSGFPIATTEESIAAFGHVATDFYATDAGALLDTIGCMPQAAAGPGWPCIAPQDYFADGCTPTKACSSPPVTVRFALTIRWPDAVKTSYALSTTTGHIQWDIGLADVRHITGFQYGGTFPVVAILEQDMSPFGCPALGSAICYQETGSGQRNYVFNS